MSNRTNNSTGRTFAYLRVSTTEQTTDNQILAIRSRGFDIPDNRTVAEKISGSTLAMERTGFCNLVENKLEAGDTLVVLKLDRLGRDNIDVQKTVQHLTEKGIKLVCLDLPIPDLTSNEGKLMFAMFAAFAAFERGRIVERTQEGLLRAKAEGKQLGRPVAVKTTAKVQDCKARGLTQQQTATELGISERTVIRHWRVQEAAQ